MVTGDTGLNHHSSVEIRVLFFGLLKDVCGKADDRLEAPEDATAGSVFDHYAAQYPKLAEMAGEYRDRAQHENSRIADRRWRMGMRLRCCRR